MLADTQREQRIGNFWIGSGSPTWHLATCSRLLHDEHSLDLRKDLSEGPVRECFVNQGQCSLFWAMGMYVHFFISFPILFAPVNTQYFPIKSYS